MKRKSKTYNQVNINLKTKEVKKKYGRDISNNRSRRVRESRIKC